MTSDLVVDALAVARLTRLIGVDTMPLGPVRDRIVAQALDRAGRTGDPLTTPKVVELLECPWCLSMWVGFGVLILRGVPGWRPLAKVLAASQIAGMAGVWVNEKS